MQAVEEYHVTLVEDDDLPPDHDFALVEHDGVLWAALKRGRVASPQVLEDAWAAFRALFLP